MSTRGDTCGSRRSFAERNVQRARAGAEHGAGRRHVLRQARASRWAAQRLAARQRTGMVWRPRNARSPAQLVQDISVMNGESALASANPVPDVSASVERSSKFCPPGARSGEQIDPEGVRAPACAIPLSVELPHHVAIERPIRSNT